MELGIVGLGRMGSNMAERLRAAGHTVVGYDTDPAKADVTTLPDLVAALSAPRAVWVMVPAQVTQPVVKELGGLLSAGDLVIDGGNSRWVNDAENAELLAKSGVDYLDVGVSGGVWGKDNGYGLMVGGSDAAVERMLPIFDALRPPGPREEGFVHAGDVGAGHYAKMVHNGIEYGLMQAYAEGYELLEASPVTTTKVPQIFKAWSRGTVVRSWLLDLMVRALDADDDLSELRGYAEDSGEGRWTVEQAVDLSVPMPVISAALFARFASRQADSPAMKAVAALRKQFGGHAVESAATDAGPSSGTGDAR